MEAVKNTTSVMTNQKESRKEKNSSLQKFLKAPHDLAFHHFHGKKLIYNSCWEDPRIDRQLLQLNGDSRVVMITSAGCNALDYLLDEPAEIHAIDMNYRQNALLELKLAMIRQNQFETFFEFFGIGSCEKYRSVYKRLREDLPEFAQEYWDEKISYFDPFGLKKSFYYRGTAGSAAWILGNALFQAKPNIKNYGLSLLDSSSLEEQREIFELLEPKLWSKLSNWLVRQWAVMALLGVPRPQIKLIEDHYPGGLSAYIKDKLRHVMIDLPASENYFWRVYITGSYTRRCCPNYLRREHQPALERLQSRIHTHTASITNFLRKNPGQYSHYVLLDHQDWLAWNDPTSLLEEWTLILENSYPGTKILLRSAGLNLSFIPNNVLERLRFYPDVTTPLHQQDRVGTYGSLHFAEVI